MKTLTSASLGDAAAQVASARNVDENVVREAIMNAMRLGNLGHKGFGFLSFAGLLPVNLPDGTRIVVLPDIHVPAHHKKILWAVLEFLKDYRPHIVILIGDVADVFALSRWPSPPRVAKNQQDELNQTRRLVDKIVEVSGCIHLFYIMGNHEDRAFRYLTDPAAGLANILDFQTLEPILSFHGMMGYKPGDPVTFLYDLAEKGGYGGGIVINGDMEFHHGFIVRPNPGASPRADSDRTGRSTGHGHTHRAGMNARVTTNEVIRSYEFGHLADPKHPYLAYANLLNNWHPSIGAGVVLGGKVHVDVLPIIPVTTDGQPKFVLTFADKVYTQSDR
jgi:hypothetical protein